MNSTLTPDALGVAEVLTYDPEAFKPASHKAQDVARESDGSTQLVGYLGWKLILQRLARRRP